MNIKEQISFNNEKPTIAIVKKNERIKQFVVALGKDAVLKKHTTPVPATLVMLKGEINFFINGEILKFSAYDVYEIPVDVEHEVVGASEENMFLITQEL
ncbi:cupin domain-containing protein [Riemerella columbipharyngis]|uniref:Cupin domain-containing protein n=1 Tax=Riemerella columbipharyngis TaxID=1071918 RepID=A0A1G7CUW6_9FLAO|nr:hypothetical protein [Riemerella columbipharyngis]SDE43021.1 hypothetical protein SAMN05421544_10927 [Riemerella columbipharyngis]